MLQEHPFLSWPTIRKKCYFQIVTYLVHCENFVDAFELIADIIAITTNLATESISVKVVWDLQVIARGWNALDRA